MNEHEAPAYRAAGVDLRAADQVVERLKPLAAETATAHVESGLGSFGGFFAYPDVGGEQLLIASIDGVGTKMKVARLTGAWEAAGYDIVSHCVDDILVHGAQPLFFLDYIGTAALDVEAIAALGRGMADACREAGCALLGGETAEMPGVYCPGEIDLVGCIVGSVRRSALLSGDRVRPGDQLIGLASNGLHTNGYSLARKLLLEGGPGGDFRLPDGQTVAAALSARHRMYRSAVAPLLERPELHAMAHITGGGIPGNLVRVLPRDCRARVAVDAWERPPIFRLLAEQGVDPLEMHRVFNMGIGWILAVASEVAEAWETELRERGERAWRIGEVSPGARGVELTGLGGAG